MKKNIYMLILAFTMLFIMSTTTYADSEIPVSEFENEDFYNYILGFADSNADGILMESEALEITQLMLYASGIDSEIVSFKGIQYFTNLQDLYTINFRQFTDTQYIKMLPNLTSLVLDDAEGITDFSFLNDMTYLRSLSVENTNVSDISFVTGMKSLNGFYCGNCPNITDYSPLANCNGLYSFRATGNEKLTDISFLEGKAIDHLELLGCTGIRDFSAISGCNFVTLKIEGEHIEHIDFLNPYENMDCLTINNANKVSDFSKLGNCTKIRMLKLPNCNINDISWMNNMTVLDEVNVNDNNISDISPLASSANTIRFIYANNNAISDLSFLTNFTKLYTLSVNNNNISELPNLKDLSTLRYVYADNNNISIEEVKNKLDNSISYNGQTLSDYEINEEITDSDEEDINESNNNRVITSILDEDITVEGQIDEETYLEGERITDTLQYEDIINEMYDKISDVREVRIYDIALYKDVIDGDSRVKVKVQPDKSVKVSIRARGMISGSVCKIYRQEEDGSLTELSCVTNGQIVTFYSEHFSIFTLVITKFLGEDTDDDNSGGIISEDELEGNGTEITREYDTLTDESNVAYENESTAGYEENDKDEEKNAGTENKKNNVENEEKDNNKVNKNTSNSKRRSSNSEKIKVAIVAVVSGIVVLDIVAYEVYAWDKKKNVK